jgi:hypothetical protein
MSWVCSQTASSGSVFQNLLDVLDLAPAAQLIHFRRDKFQISWMWERSSRVSGSMI